MFAPADRPIVSVLNIDDGLFPTPHVRETGIVALAKLALLLFDATSAPDMAYEAEEREGITGEEDMWCEGDLARSRAVPARPCSTVVESPRSKGGSGA